MGANWVGVIVAAIAAMVVGAFWYGPLFGQPWMRAMGWDPSDKAKMDQMKKGVGLSYVWQFIASLLMAYILTVFINSLGGMGWLDGAKVAFWAWVGFVLTIKFGDSLWGGKKDLFWISSGNMLVTMLIMGAILGAWH